MDKETKNIIKQLKRDKNYHAIFVNFGRIAYLNNIPRSLLHARIQEMKEVKGGKSLFMGDFTKD